ncbi:hypothetical protein [Fibrobacter sp.]|uniref:hypothetical protein n=1 Tax=Fibrobacter sp. TaxID=35828 RepID=UPI00386733F7
MVSTVKIGKFDFILFFIFFDEMENIAQLDVACDLIFFSSSERFIKDAFISCNDVVCDFVCRLWGR